MKWATKRVVDVTCWPLLAFSAGLWLGSVAFGEAGYNVFTANDLWGFVIRVALSGVALYMVILSFKNRNVFFESSQSDNLSVFVSPDVFRTLIKRVLENFGTVTLKSIVMRPSKLEGVKELIVDISTTDPFSLSEVLKELYDKISMTIKESLGDEMGVNVIVKVRSFEVNKHDE
jgi:hypothetical protein